MEAIVDDQAKHGYVIELEMPALRKIRKEKNKPGCQPAHLPPVLRDF